MRPPAECRKHAGDEKIMITFRTETFGSMKMNGKEEEPYDLGNGDDIDDNYESEEERASMTIGNIVTCNDDYSNDFDISMGDLDDDESQDDDFFHPHETHEPLRERENPPFLPSRAKKSELSLLSFTSMNSFSSHQGNGEGTSGGDSVQIGDLVFCSDEEVAKLMYGDDENYAAGNNVNEEMMKSTWEDNLSNPSCTNNDTNLVASLPPSGTLGSGAFSAVRLAWRTTPDDDADTSPSTSCQDIHGNTFPELTTSHFDGKKRQLVAVKIIQKSILKQIKSIQRDPNNRVTVHTAYDNIEREIATMKRLKHPNVVRLFEVIDSVESDRLYMVLEYVSLGKRDKSSIVYSNIVLNETAYIHIFFFGLGEILSHVEGTDRYTRMRYRKRIKGLTSDGHFDETHAALYFVDILHGIAYLHR